MTFYAIFTSKVGIHDSGEYITIAKELAGIGNIQVFSAHSIVYPLFLSLFLRISPNLLTIKLISVSFLIIIGFILYKLFNNKKALILWIFSPLIWFVGIEVSPVLPVALFLLLGYHFFIEWEKKNKRIFLILSGFCWGVTFALWGASIILISFFLLIFFWKKKFNDVIYFFIGILPAVFIRLIVDYFVFGFPFNTLIRYFGVNLVFLSGLGYDHVNPLTLTLLLRILFFISPLLILAFFIGFKKDKREFLFLFLNALFFFFRSGEPRAFKYFITFSPIFVIFFSKSFNWKKIFINSIISIFLIFILINSYFTYDFQNNLQKDLGHFKKDFPFDEVLAGKDEALLFASNSWTTKPKFLWWKEYELTKDGGEYYSNYFYKVNPNINQHKILYIQFSLMKKNNQSFEGIPLISVNKEEDHTNFKLVKSYDTFDVYFPK